MKIYKATFIITLTAGIVLIGIYLQVTGNYATGYISRHGEVSFGVFNGYSAIFLGIVVLLFSIWAFKIYKKQKEKFRKLR